MPRFRLVRTASFRLAAAYLGLFTLSVLLLGAVVFVTVRREAMRDVEDRIAEESAALGRVDSESGRPRLLEVLKARGAGVGAFAYGLADASGRLVAGDLDPRPAANAPPALGWTLLREPERDDAAEAGGENVRALVAPLADGALLVVGDEWNSARRTTRAILVAFGWATAATLTLGALGGLALSAAVLRRIDAMSRAARAIMAGDWRQRIPAINASDELADLARTFNRLFDRIEALLAANKHVGEAVAHDLRKPLAAALRRLEAARDEAAAPQREAAIAGAIEDIHDVLATFNAILRISQIEAGARRAGFKRVDLATIARDVVEAFQPAAEEQSKTIALRFDGPSPLDGDAELLTQLIANLLDNALTHTPAGARIEVRGDNPAGAPRLIVADDGPGVPKGERERIFERFHRLDAARATPGSGLGLSLVAAVAELHGLRARALDNQPGLRVVIEAAADEGSARRI